MTPTTAPQKRSGPGAQARTEAGNFHNRIRQSSRLTANASSRPIDVLLSRLDGVRRSGRGWIARCPAHDDRSASLSIAEGDGDRVLAHCFAGCEIADALAAVGLSIADLFPERPRDQSPLGRAQRREAMQAANVAAAVAVLAREVDVVSAAAGTLAHGDALDDADRGRLALAASRIHDIKAVLNG